MIVKLTSEQVKLIGATDAKDFSEKFLAFVQEANELKDMADSPVDTSALEKRIADLEASAKTFTTEARVTTLVTEGATKTLNDWATSDAGKKIIGAEASRITLEAIAAIGTTPAKPSPANPATPPANPKTFAELVNEKVAAGMKKSQAITSLVGTKEYQEFLKTGGKL